MCVESRNTAPRLGAGSQEFLILNRPVDLEKQHAQEIQISTAADRLLLDHISLQAGAHTETTDAASTQMDMDSGRSPPRTATRCGQHTFENGDKKSR